jgi:drug/metabolite transporter (DMT)-like permease
LCGDQLALTCQYVTAAHAAIVTSPANIEFVAHNGQPSPMLPSRTRSSFLAYAYLVIAALTWGGTWVVVRGLRDDFPPIAIAFWRWVAAAVILLPFAWRHLRIDLPKYQGHWPTVLTLGAIGTVTFAALGALGVQHTTATNASLINSITPIFCFVFSVALLRTPVTGRFTAAMLLCLIGVLCITAQGRIETILALDFNRGDLLVLLASVGWAAYSVGLRWTPQGVNPIAFLFIVSVIGLILWAPFYAMEIASGRTVAMNWRTAGIALFLGLFPSVIAYIGWNYAVPRVGAHIAALFGNLVPVFGIALAILILGESLQIYHAIGMALIFTGLYFVSRGK